MNKFIIFNKERLDMQRDGKASTNDSKQTPAEAVKLARQNLRDSSQGCLEMADAYFHNAEYSNALAFYDKAIRYSEHEKQSSNLTDHCLTFTAYHHRAKCHAIQSKYDKDHYSAARKDFFTAMEICDGEKKDNRTIAALWVEVGDMDYHRGEYYFAIDHYRRAIEKDPQNVQAHRNRGLAYFQIGLYCLRCHCEAVQDFETAIRHFSDALTLKPNDHELFYRRGLAYAKLQKYIKAIQDFTQALQLNPEDQESYQELTQVYQDAIYTYTRSYYDGPDNKFLKFIMDPRHWGVSAERSVFGQPRSFLWEVIGPAKENTFNRFAALKRADKLEAWCQSLIPTTVLGNLFYTQLGVYAPSVKDGNLKKIATAMQNEFKVGDEKLLKTETKEALKENIELQKKLKEHHKELYGKFLEAKLFQKLEEAEVSVAVVQTRLREAKKAEQGMELQERDSKQNAVALPQDAQPQTQQRNAPLQQDVQPRPVVSQSEMTPFWDVTPPERKMFTGTAMQTVRSSNLSCS